MKFCNLRKEGDCPNCGCFTHSSCTNKKREEFNCITDVGRDFSDTPCNINNCYEKQNQ